MVFALVAFLLGGCVHGGASEPALREAPLASLRPCYVPRADLFFFEKDWLRVKGRELDALKFGNALWWLDEASWNEAFDAKEVYGAEQQIFGTLSRAPQGPRPTLFQEARLLFLEEREVPLAPLLLSVRVTDSTAFFYVKSLSRGKRQDPKGAGCWGGTVIREQRALTVREAQPTLECARLLMTDRTRAEPWSPLPEEGRDTQYLVEYRDGSLHGLAQYSSQVSNIDGVSLPHLQECTRLFLSMARKATPVPIPTAPAAK